MLDEEFIGNKGQNTWSQAINGQGTKEVIKVILKMEKYSHSVIGI